MGTALMINLENAATYIIDVKPIKDLHYEFFISPGIVIFFDKNYDIIMFAESFISIEDVARDIEPEDAFYYHIIKDDKHPMTEKQLDYIYEGIRTDKFSIHIISNKERINFTLCMN